MIRFSALNQNQSREALSPRDASGHVSRTKEAQESAALEKYNSALALQQSGKLDRAKVSYGELLELPLVTSENSHNPTGTRLKYLSLKNLAAISIARGCHEEALPYFVEAANVDSSDVVLWYHMGRTALLRQQLPLARHAFEQALALHSDYWPCVDSLCSALFAIGDYHSCLDAVLSALALDSDYERGRAFLQHMSLNEKWLPQWTDEPLMMFKWLRNSLPQATVSKYVDEAVKLRPVPPSPGNSCKTELQLSALSWLSLGSELLSLWSRLRDSDLANPLSVSVSLSDAIASASSNDFQAASATGAPCDRHASGGSSDGGDMDQQLGRQSLKRKHVQAVVGGGSPQQTSIQSSPGTPKRRSTRNRTLGKKESSDCPRISERLRTFLPVELQCQPIRTPLPSTPSPSRQSQSRVTGPLSAVRHHPFASDQSSGEEISDFLCRHVNNQGLLDLVTKYLTNLACNRRNVVWPMPLRKTFCQLYSLVRPCWSAPHIEARSEDSKRISKLAWLALVACELALDTFTIEALVAGTSSKQSSNLLQSLGGMFGSDLQFLVSATVPIPVMGVEFASRVYWLAAHVASQLNQPAAAIEQFCKALHAVEYDDDVISDSTAENRGRPLRVFSLKLCTHNPIISGGAIRQRIETVTKQKTFDEIKENFSSGNHEKVIETLAPLLDDGPLPSSSSSSSADTESTQLDILGNAAGPSERHRQLLLLQDAYFQLGRFQECLRCAEVNMSDVLSMADRIDSHIEPLNKILQVIPKCLKKPSVSYSNLPKMSQWRLSNSLLQIIDHMSLNLESYHDNLPVALPWLVLHNVVKQISPSSLCASRNATPARSAVDRAAASSETPLSNDPNRTGPAAPAATASTATATASTATAAAGEDAMDCGEHGASSGDAVAQAAAVPAPGAVQDSSATVTETPTKPGGGGAAAAAAGQPADYDESSRASCASLAADHDPLPQHFRILQMAHATLGRHGLCCSLDGHLLLITIKEGRKILPLVDSTARDEVTREVEQCYFCLYGHPNKKHKARRLEDHGSAQIELTWTHAMDLFDFFCPVTQPTFDSTKIGFSMELLNLFRRIVTVLSRSIEPVVTLDALHSYLDDTPGSTLVIPAQVARQPVVSEIYHLLADFHLKNADYLKSSKCYLLDLCYNPQRFDSWAGLALAKSKRIEERVNSLDTVGNTARFVQRHGGPTVVCYSQACNLNSHICCLQEQFGLFSYGLGSLTSRYRYSQAQFDAASSGGSGDDGGCATTLDKSVLLKQARTSFLACLNLRGEEDDAWLHRLMLAKIAYKTGGPLQDSLSYCMQAQQFLEVKGVHTNHYRKVSFANTTENLAALASVEIFYRIHVIILKMLLKGEVGAEERQAMCTYLCRARRLPFAVANAHDSACGATAGNTAPGSSTHSMSGDPFSPPPATTSQDSTAAASSLATVPASAAASRHLSVGRLPSISAEDEDTNESGVSRDGEKPGDDDDGGGAGKSTAAGPVSSAHRDSSSRVRRRASSSSSLGQQGASKRSFGSASDYDNDDVWLTGGEREGLDGDGDGVRHEPTARELLARCIEQLTLCVRGFSRHYRTVYRLAHFYATSEKDKDLQRARALLLHGTSDGDKLHLPQCSLFRLKAPFFQFWKSPIEELERPGSFVVHIRRSLLLLHSVLVELVDTAHLLAVAQYLYKKPEQAKKFLHDTDRVSWANKMLTSCLSLLAKQLRQEVENVLQLIPADDAGSSSEDAYPSVASYTGLLECLNSLFQVRSTAVKTKFDQTELDALFVEAGQVLSPWMFADRSAEAVESLTREELICCTVAFQQYFQPASQSHAMSTSSALNAESSTMPAAAATDSSSQLPHSKGESTSKAGGVPSVACAMLHMSGVEPKHRRAAALLTVGVPSPPSPPPPSSPPLPPPQPAAVEPMSPQPPSPQPATPESKQEAPAQPEEASSRAEPQAAPVSELPSPSKLEQHEPMEQGTT